MGNTQATQTDNRRTFGEALRRLRVAAGLSQKALAERAHLYRTYVGSVEHGERYIAVDYIHALADAIGVDVRRLFDPYSDAQE